MTKSLDQLRDFAIERHGDQRYGDGPYVVHLDDVRSIARRHGLAEVYERAAYGHDLIDDTGTTKAEIETEFGVVEAALVHAVSGPGENRKARRVETIRRLEEDPRGIDLKGCDRIANFGAALRDDNLDLVKMYLGEKEAYAGLFEWAKPSIQAELQDLYDRARQCVASARCSARPRP